MMRRDMMMQMIFIVMIRMMMMIMQMIFIVMIMMMMMIMMRCENNDYAKKE